MVGPTNRSRNGLSHFKLAQCCFWSIISPHAKFHPNQTENTEVENFHRWSVLVGWAGKSKNGCSHFKLVLCFLVLHNKFHLNRTKNTEIEKCS